MRCAALRRRQINAKAPILCSPRVARRMTASCLETGADDYITSLSAEGTCRPLQRRPAQRAAGKLPTRRSAMRGAKGISARTREAAAFPCSWTRRYRSCALLENPDACSRPALLETYAAQRDIDFAPRRPHSACALRLDEPEHRGT